MNISEFSSMRSKSGLDTDIVELWVEDCFSPWRTNQVVVPINKVLSFSDCMAFAGTSIFVHAEHYSETLAKNFESLKKHADYILVAITDFGEDLGFEYRKELQ